MINKSILSKAVQEFIDLHLHDNPAQLILKGSPFKGISSKELAQQIEGKKRVQKKLPTWFKTEGIYYPPTLNLSQASSEVTAHYKAALITGHSLVDITGGFGVDDYFFLQKFDQVIYCEQNLDLAEIVRHNLSLLNPFKAPIYYVGDSLNYVKKQTQKIDWIYADPARRSYSGKKIFKLEDSKPNILEHLHLLLSKSKGILLKTSPLLDLQLGLEQIKMVQEIHIVAVKNEVKELLWVVSEQSQKEIRIKTVNFEAQHIQTFLSFWGEEKSIESPYSHPQTYLYEPNSAILKAGLFKKVAKDFNLNKLAANTHLYTSTQLVDFPGRRFRIIKTLPYNKRNVKSLQLDNAHITTRNFPLSVKQIRQIHNIAEGGEIYLFCTQTFDKSKIIIWCEKTKFKASAPSNARY